MSTPPLELPLLSQPVRAPQRDQRWLRDARLARLLTSLSLAWLIVDGTVGAIAGLIAGSVALVGSGLDSAIESIASVIVI